MGLDLYLNVKEYASRWDYSDGYENKKELPTFTNIINVLPDARDFLAEDGVGCEISYIAMYWRKANAIHQWFVDNVQEGEDNCAEYYVSLDSLKDLKTLCAEVLANKNDKEFIADNLPPQEGFFFGSTDIDEWYFEDIQYTYDRLSVLIAKADELAKRDRYIQFAYQASW